MIRFPLSVLCLEGHRRRVVCRRERDLCLSISLAGMIRRNELDAARMVVACNDSLHDVELYWEGGAE